MAQPSQTLSKTISVTIAPKQLSFKNMEKHKVFELLIKTYSIFSKNMVIGKEKGSKNYYTHYQIYIYKSLKTANAVRKLTDTLLIPYLIENEHDQKIKRWRLVKYWQPKPNDKIQNDIYGTGYCLKECGQTFTNFDLANQQIAKDYYEKMHTFKPPDFRKLHPHINHALCKCQCPPGKYQNPFLLCRCKILKCIRCEYDKSKEKRKFYYHYLLKQETIAVFKHKNEKLYSKNVQKIKEWWRPGYWKFSDPPFRTYPRSLYFQQLFGEKITPYD